MSCRAASGLLAPSLRSAGSKLVSNPEKAITSSNRQKISPQAIRAKPQSHLGTLALGKMGKHAGTEETLKGDELPSRARGTDIVGRPNGAQSHSAGLGWQLGAAELCGHQHCSDPRPGQALGSVGWPQLGKGPSAAVAVVLLRPELSARALKQGGESWSRLVPTFGVAYLHCIGCRQPSSSRVPEQAAPAGSRWPSARGRVLLQEGTQLCLASV